jgi:hypothetical protein
MTRLLSYLGRFLELRLRAFVYALFALVGFQIGMIVHQGMALAAIDQFEEQVKAAVMEARS